MFSMKSSLAGLYCTFKALMHTPTCSQTELLFSNMHHIFFQVSFITCPYSVSILSFLHRLSFAYKTLFFSVYTLSLGDLICLRSLNPIYKLTYLKCISAAQTFLQLQTFPQLPTFISDGLCNRHLKCNTSKFKLFISKLPKVPVYWLSISINGTSIFLQLKENSVFLTSYLC